jgi:glycerol kinase
LETTALGAAYLAGLQSGLYPAPDVFAEQWARDRTFQPGLDAARRGRMLASWHRAVRRTLLESDPRPK